MTQFSIGIAIIGFGFGTYMGGRLAPHDRNAPGATGIVGAVLFYLAAEVLITAAGLALLGLTLYFAVRAWPTVHESLITFARESGMRINTTSRNQPSVAERIAAMRHDFESRSVSSRGLGLSEKDEEECLEEAETTLRQSAKRLAGTDYFPET